MWQFKSVAPWANRLAMRGLFLAGTTEAVTSAPVETPDTRTQRIDVVQHRHTPTTTAAPMRPRRITQRPTARPMPKQRMAAANTTRLHSDWWYDACSSGA